ncbi:hypothetical protein KM043_006023 [Ampulex compressa]|nr:hypothetical protein KM043_006023 [Ampulex compressa]
MHRTWRPYRPFSSSAYSPSSKGIPPRKAKRRDRRSKTEDRVVVDWPSRRQVRSSIGGGRPAAEVGSESERSSKNGQEERSSSRSSRIVLLSGVRIIEPAGWPTAIWRFEGKNAGAGKNDEWPGR